MFNVGPTELLVLVLVGVIVVGPERLPRLAKDGARVLGTLRELATGARRELGQALGPEFSDLRLGSLNPRTLVQQTVLGDLPLPGAAPGTGLRRLLADPGTETAAGQDPESAPAPARQPAPVGSGPATPKAPRRPMPGPGGAAGTVPR